MIILDTKNLALSPEYILRQLKQIIYVIYLSLKENHSESVLMISELFSDKEIKDAINSIYLDKHRNIVSDSQSRYDKILRYLEYGGEAVKSPHLISKAISNIERRS